MTTLAETKLKKGRLLPDEVAEQVDSWLTYDQRTLEEINASIVEEEEA